MQTYYDRVFLERAKAELVHDVGAQRRTIPMNSGKTIVWNRFAPLAVVTTPITESDFTPSAVDMTTTQVTATLADYGNWTKVSGLFKLTSLDEDLQEHVEVHGQNAGESLDALVREELFSGATVQLANNKSNITAIAATDVLTGAEIRKAVRTLKKNKAKRHPNGYFYGIVQPDTAYDLMGNSEWLDAYRYTSPENIRAGLLGRLHGVEFYETNQGKTEASNTTVYSNFICGRNAYGTVSLEGQPGSRIYVKQPGPSSTDNPLDTFSTVGWRATFATKVLNSSWVVNIKTGATA
jgi:N4-gp56 family major capsid protein